MARRCSSRLWSGWRYSGAETCRSDGGGLLLFSSAEAMSEPIQIKVNHRSGVKSEKLGEQQTADNGNAKRAAELGTGALLNGQGQRAEKGGHGGHHDGAEAEQAGFVD